MYVQHFAQGAIFSQGLCGDFTGCGAIGINMYILMDNLDSTWSRFLYSYMRLFF